MGKQWKRASKLKQDLQKGALFTKLVREIKTATLEAGANPENNPRLRLALREAKQNLLPKDTIRKAISNASLKNNSSKDGSLLYEGYGPHALAVLIECLSNNPVRTATLVRNGFKNFGGKLGEIGCLKWMFDRVGIIRVKNPASKEKKNLDFNNLCKKSGANHFTIEKNEEVCFYVNEKNIKEVEAFFNKNKSLTVLNSYIGYLANNYIELNTKERKDIEKFISYFENCEDCLNIFTNLKPI